MNHQGALMTKASAARFLGMSKDTFYARLRKEPTFPQPVEVHTVSGPIQRYRRSDLERWVQDLEEQDKA